jgi:hypothetical protein
MSQHYVEPEAQQAYQVGDAVGRGKVLGPASKSTTFDNLTHQINDELDACEKTLAHLMQTLQPVLMNESDEKTPPPGPEGAMLTEQLRNMRHLLGRVTDFRRRLDGLSGRVTL